MSLEHFNPNDLGQANGNFAGLPFTYNEAEIVIIPIPWDVTTSYMPGTSRGPQAVLDYSTQLDLYDFDYPNLWQRGIFMKPISKLIQAKNDGLRKRAEAYIQFLEKGGTLEKNKKMQSELNAINQGCEELKTWVKKEVNKCWKDGKKVVLLGGDHSTPLGYLELLAEKHPGFGILQIDAHADLRIAYEGFTYSHASIMYNALQLSGIERLISVGVRDICDEEIDIAKKSDGRILPYYDHIIRREMLKDRKQTWHKWCKNIIAALPDEVYISFDIDGLRPEYCPNTGTPVPGGLDMQEAYMLINQVVKSGRKIIGLDLNEVSLAGGNVSKQPALEYNANVGTRLLNKMILAMLASNPQN